MMPVRITICILITWFLNGASIAAERIALVAGVAEYQSISKLDNTIRDAKLISKALRSLDFEVVEVLDHTLEDMRAAVKRFSFKAESAEIAVVYFAGHGMELNGQNFLLPADVVPDSRESAAKASIPLEELLVAVEKARQMRIVILDSCRNDPFSKPGEIAANVSSLTPRTGGLAKPSPDRGTLVAFAARDGQTALDGQGLNSPFASALSKHLTTPDLEISLLFRRVRDNVLKRTGNQQEPHTYGSLPGKPFFLAGQTQKINELKSFDRLISWSRLKKDEQSQLEALAREGDQRAMKGVAYMRLDSTDEKFAPERAYVLLAKVAYQGDPEAKYELGKLHESGIGTKQDIAQAITLYKEAAEADYPDALNDLGFLYFQGGIGVPRDPKRGLRYFERAAELRHPEAMYNFAALIDDGIVPGKTVSDSAKYLYDSLRSGNEKVIAELSANPRMFKQATMRELQTKLRSFDFYEGSVDGRFGPQTKRGLERAYGIED